MRTAIIGKRIIFLRESKGLSQAELSKILGIQKSAMSYFENGSRIPKVEIIEAICDYFNVSTDYLLGRTDIRTPDADIKLICEKTGLTEKTVFKLVNYDEWLVDCSIDSFLTPEEKDKMKDERRAWENENKEKLCLIKENNVRYSDLLNTIRGDIDMLAEFAMIVKLSDQADERTRKEILRGNLWENPQHHMSGDGVWLNNAEAVWFLASSIAREMEGAFASVFFDRIIESNKEGDPDGGDKKEE